MLKRLETLEFAVTLFICDPPYDFNNKGDKYSFFLSSLTIKKQERKKTGLALRMTDLTKNIWFAVFLPEFEMMFIINVFALVTFATILYITLKCDIYLNGLLFHSEVVFTLFFFYMKLSFFLVVG